MLDEIRQQPEALARTLEGGFESAEDLRRRFTANRPHLIVLVARGTSDNAAVFGRYLIEIATGIPVSLAAPSVVTLYRRTLDLTGALVVGVSQSGESTDTNAVMEDARRRGAATVAITNEAASSLAGICEFCLLARAEREESVAATKTYTSQLMAFYLLAWALGADVDADQLRQIPDAVRGAIDMEKRVAAIAERYTFMTHAVTVGRGLNYANALEFGLKLMETCYVVAERFSAADLMHGPIAMVERAFPVFVFAPCGVTWNPVAGVLERVAKLTSETLAIAEADNREVGTKASRVISVPQIPRAAEGAPADLYTPIPLIVPAQLFAAHLASIKGLDPDRPRTLQKVTQTL